MKKNTGIKLKNPFGKVPKAQDPFGKSRKGTNPIGGLIINKKNKPF